MPGLPMKLRKETANSARDQSARAEIAVTMTLAADDGYYFCLSFSLALTSLMISYCSSNAGWYRDIFPS